MVLGECIDIVKLIEVRNNQSKTREDNAIHYSEWVKQNTAPYSDRANEVVSDTPRVIKKWLRQLSEINKTIQQQMEHKTLSIEQIEAIVLAKESRELLSFFEKNKDIFKLKRIRPHDKKELEKRNNDYAERKINTQGIEFTTPSFVVYYKCIDDEKKLQDIESPTLCAPHSSYFKVGQNCRVFVYDWGTEERKEVPRSSAADLAVGDKAKVPLWCWPAEIAENLGSIYSNLKSVQEEPIFSPPLSPSQESSELKGATVADTKTLEVSGNVVIVSIWDDGYEDGDIIDIYRGDVLIHRNLVIKKEKFEIEIPLNDGKENKIRCVAKSQGSAGNCTMRASVKGTPGTVSLKAKTGQVMEINLGKK